MSKKGLKNVDVYTLCAHKSGHNSGLKDQQDIIKILTINLKGNQYFLKMC